MILIYAGRYPVSRFFQQVFLAVAMVALVSSCQLLNPPAATPGTNTPSGHLMGGTMQGVTLSLAGQVSTLFGGVSAGFTDGGKATALVSQPLAVTADGTNLYFVDKANNAVRKINQSTGQISTVAGSLAGASGFADGLPRRTDHGRPEPLYYRRQCLYSAQT